MIKKKQLLKRIEKLETELKKDLMDDQVYTESPRHMWGYYMKPIKRATHKGKLDALLEHLGLEIPDIDPEEKPKVRVKKLKK